MTAKRLMSAGGSVLVAFGFVMLWQLIADAQLVSAVFLPGPDRAVEALLRGLSDGDLAGQLMGTVERMVFGWLFASVAGILIGAAIGISPTARVYLEPMLEFVRPLPASAIIPVAIALLGMTDAMVLVVIAFGALWPMLLATIHGFSSVEPRLYEVSRSLGLGRLDIIWKIALPSALPGILAGMRIGLTIALILAVVGEMLGSREGLGLWLLSAARAYRAPDLFAGVILLGLTGLTSTLLLTAAENRLLRWRQTT